MKKHVSFYMLKNPSKNFHSSYVKEMFKLNSSSEMVKFFGTLHHKYIPVVIPKMITVWPNKNNQVLGIKIASHKRVIIYYTNHRISKILS